MSNAWIAKLVVCAAVVTTVSPASFENPKEGLDTVAWRVAHAIRKGDYASFERDAAPTFTIEERWRAYDDYFKDPARFTKGMLGNYDETMVSSVSRVMASSPKPGDRKLFSNFGVQLRQAWTSDHPGTYGTPRLQRLWQEQGAESIDLNGPAIGSPFVSNIDWAIEFEQIDGRWKARRLVLMGH